MLDQHWITVAADVSCCLFTLSHLKGHLTKSHMDLIKYHMDDLLYELGNTVLICVKPSKNIFTQFKRN